jgi:hypothetical protein
MTSLQVMLTTLSQAKKVRRIKVTYLMDSRVFLLLEKNGLSGLFVIRRCLLRV